MYFKYMKFGFLGIFANLIEILVQGFVFSNALNWGIQHKSSVSSEYMA